MLKHDPNAIKPEHISYEVKEGGNEEWSEGINLFHNPNALLKIDKKKFLNIAHHEFKDGLIYSDTPEFHPYFSFNINLVDKN